MTTVSSGVYIGVMSGTSLDGIDLVAVSFEPLIVHATLTLPFEESLRDALLALTQPGDNEIERMGVADVALAKAIAAGVNTLKHDKALTGKDIIAVASHGQTIRHRPDSGFSLQIGDPNWIAELTHLPVIADFRRRDMAAGGQGAPLVPAFHQYLFQHWTIPRIVLNLGGIANITLLPAGNDHPVSGYDTGPANLLMDAWCQYHTGALFDRDGQWASMGTIHWGLLELLLSHEFFSRPAPKSTGREEFHRHWLEQQLQQLEPISAQDVQATLVRFTAQTVADAIRHSDLSNDEAGGEVWLCGGGAFNPLLCQQLAELLPNWVLRQTSEAGLAPQWVEATAFAWLGWRRIQGLPGNMPAVTGAQHPRVLGMLSA
mgnify:CR=1 FL=1